MFGHRKKPCSIQFVEASLFDIEADAYLVSIGENCLLQGQVAQHIKKNFSDNIEKKLKNAAPLGKGECILIEDRSKIFIFGMPFDYEIAQLTIAGVEMVVGRAFEICDANRIKSIAIPAIAANHMPGKTESINHIIQLGVDDYFFRTPHSEIKQVYLVNYIKKVFSPIKIRESEKEVDKTIYLDIE